MHLTLVTLALLTAVAFLGGLLTRSQLIDSTTNPAETVEQPGCKVASSPGHTARLSDHERCEDVLDGILFTRLRDEGASLVEARRTVAAANRLGVRARVLLMWLDVFDLDTLTLALAADLDENHLVTYLRSGQAPHADDLNVFAEFNNYDVVLRHDRRNRVGAQVTVKSTQHRLSSTVEASNVIPVLSSHPVPPIFEPGDWSNINLPTRGAPEPSPAQPASVATWADIDTAA